MQAAAVTAMALTLVRNDMTGLLVAWAQLGRKGARLSKDAIAGGNLHVKREQNPTLEEDCDAGDQLRREGRLGRLRRGDMAGLPSGERDPRRFLPWPAARVDGGHLRSRDGRPAGS